MENMLSKFTEWIKTEDRYSTNTLQSYTIHIQNYISWYHESFGLELTKLYRENILDYISYLLNIKKLNAKSVNSKLAALSKFNEFLIENGINSDLVIYKKDYFKIQTPFINPATVNKKDVESFRQSILETGNRRNYALVTLLAYSGLRISEAINLKLDDISLTSREVLIREGKGKKQRLIIINDKIVNAINVYLKERDKQRFKDSQYLFISREGEKISRSRINHIFNDIDKEKRITPHILRHFFCSYALENNWAVHEVAYQAGHASITTTSIYTNPSREKMKDKANLL